MELELGLFDNDTGHDNDQCIVVNRVVNDMENNIEDDRAEEYIDVIGGKPRRVKRSIQQKIDSLRDEEVPELVRFYGFASLPIPFSLSFPFGVVVFASFSFGFEDGMWDSIVLIPDHCPSLHFLIFLSITLPESGQELHSFFA